MICMHDTFWDLNCCLIKVLLLLKRLFSQIIVLNSNVWNRWSFHHWVLVRPFYSSGASSAPNVRAVPFFWSTCHWFSSFCLSRWLGDLGGISFLRIIENVVVEANTHSSCCRCASWNTKGGIFSFHVLWGERIAAVRDCHAPCWW